jgi:hypothetical protein
MEYSDFWKANSYSTCREMSTLYETECLLPHAILRTTCPYPEPDQSSPCPFHFWKINVNIIFPSMSVSSTWFLSLRSQHQNPLCTCLSPLHDIPPSSLYSCFSIWWDVDTRIRKLLLCNLFHFPGTSSHLYPNTILTPLFCNTSYPVFLLQCERPSFTHIHNSRQNYNPVHVDIDVCG